MRFIKLLLRSFFSIVFIGIFLICLGLPVYYFNIASEPTDNQEKTDAIVVLTGGKDRIREGIRLLNAGLAERLLISGVGKGTRTSELLEAAMTGWQDMVKTDVRKISLGYKASNTVGNASESENWIRANNIHSIRLVTANYHMARAHLEFRKTMPSLVIIENPVFPDDFHKEKWEESKPTRDLIIKEYFKYLYSWLGLGEK